MWKSWSRIVNDGLTADPKMKNLNQAPEVSSLDLNFKWLWIWIFKENVLKFQYNSNKKLFYISSLQGYRIYAFYSLETKPLISVSIPISNDMSIYSHSFQNELSTNLDQAFSR